MNKPTHLDEATELMRQFAAYKADHPMSDFAAFGTWLASPDRNNSATEAEPRLAPAALSSARPSSGDTDWVAAGIMEADFQKLMSLPERLSRLPYGDAPALPGTGRWHEHKPIEARLGMLFRRMFRHANHYMRKILEPMGLRNVEDFMYLSLATNFENPSKSELIAAGMSEYTGGIEIINRLIKLGMMTEEPSPTDKRKKIVVVTAQGYEILADCYVQFTKMNALVYRGVSDLEKEIVYNILAGLDHYHTYLGQEKKHASIAELIAL